MFQTTLSTGASLLLSVGFASAFSWDSTREQQAQKLVRDFQILHQVPSIAISITVNGNSAIERSFDIDGSIIPQGEKVRYHIGSVSKQFTAAAALALIEDRTIVPSTSSPMTLDTTLSELFPTVDRSSQAGKVTVQRLLTMTSNIPSYTNDTLAFSVNPAGIIPATQPVAAVDIIRRLKDYKLVGPAGTFAYSNTNYFLLALIVGALKGNYQITNPSAEHEYMHRRILAKSGTISTGFVDEPSPPDAIDATAHYLSAPLLNCGAWPMGAGDLVSTAADMARWNIALMSGRVINADLLSAMLTPVARASSGPYRGCMYGMGWYVCERPSYRLYQHDGVISGFMASNAIGLKGNGLWMSVTVLANSDATVGIVELTRSLIEVGR